MKFTEYSDLLVKMGKSRIIDSKDVVKSNPGTLLVGHSKAKVSHISHIYIDRSGELTHVIFKKDSVRIVSNVHGSIDIAKIINNIILWPESCDINFINKLLGFGMDLTFRDYNDSHSVEGEFKSFVFDKLLLATHFLDEYNFYKKTIFPFYVKIELPKIDPVARKVFYSFLRDSKVEVDDINFIITSVNNKLSKPAVSAEHEKLYESLRSLRKAMMAIGTFADLPFQHI